MQVLLNVDEEEYERIVAISKSQHYRNKLTIEQIIANGVPIHKTVTEFADRCRECGKMKKESDWKDLYNAGSIRILDGGEL